MRFGRGGLTGSGGGKRCGDPAKIVVQALGRRHSIRSWPGRTGPGGWVRDRQAPSGPPHRHGGRPAVAPRSGLVPFARRDQGDPIPHTGKRFRAAKRYAPRSDRHHSGARSLGAATRRSKTCNVHASECFADPPGSDRVPGSLGHTSASSAAVVGAHHPAATSPHCRAGSPGALTDDATGLSAQRLLDDAMRRAVRLIESRSCAQSTLGDGGPGVRLALPVSRAPGTTFEQQRVPSFARPAGDRRSDWTALRATRRHRA